jgi:hypothetical protein
MRDEQAAAELAFPQPQVVTPRQTDPVQRRIAERRRQMAGAAVGPKGDGNIPGEEAVRATLDGDSYVR